MKNSPHSRTDEQRRPEPRQHPFLRFAAVVACLCLGGALFLPTFINATGRHHVPKGQLLADARTLVATVHYLFQAESDFETKPAPLKEPALSQVPPTDNVFLETSAGISNPIVPLDASASRQAQT